VLLQDSSYWLPTPSSTFHGRDIFSPAAAHLACGVPVRKMGPALDAIVELPLEPFEITSATIRGKVVYIDRFGNLITNIRCLHWLNSEELELQPPQTETDSISPVQFNAKGAHVSIGQHIIRGIYRAYSTVGIGQPVAVIGSNSDLEISVNQGNASDALAIQIDDPITLHLD
jgi:S-adenosylmethionine hydrolase